MVKRRKYVKPEIIPKEFTSLDEIDRGIEKIKRRIDDVKAFDPQKTSYDDQKIDNVESDIRETIRDVFGTNSPEFNEHQHHRIAHGILQMGMSEVRFQKRFADGIPRTISMLEGLINRLEEKKLDFPSEAAKTIQRESSSTFKIVDLAERKLRKVMRAKPQSEKEIQDAFENLLIGADIHYSREKERIEYSSKTYTPDFTVPECDIAIEIKYCSKQEREKDLIAEINDDILAYQTEYGNLLFVVYDAGFIRDVDRRSF